MGRARKQKHGLPLATGRGVAVTGWDVDINPTVPRQAKTALKRHKILPKKGAVK